MLSYHCSISRLEDSHYKEEVRYKSDVDNLRD